MKKKELLYYGNMAPEPVTKAELRSRREVFERTREELCDISKPCVVCGEEARVRHHLILLKNGGRNTPENIVPLCHQCHSEVHPWLSDNGLTPNKPSETVDDYRARMHTQRPKLSRDRYCTVCNGFIMRKSRKYMAYHKYGNDIIICQACIPRHKKVHGDDCIYHQEPYEGKL